MTPLDADAIAAEADRLQALADANPNQWGEDRRHETWALARGLRHALTFTTNDTKDGR